MNERKYKVSERTGVNNKQITQNGYNLILKEKNNLYELRMKEHINESNDLLGRIWRDIEYYELRLDSENKVVELINKEDLYNVEGIKKQGEEPFSKNLTKEYLLLYLILS